MTGALKAVRIGRLVAVALLLAATATKAHVVDGAHEAPSGRLWNDEAWLWALVVVPFALYLLGVARLWRNALPGAGIRRWQVAAFVGGWLALALAMLSPLDALGGELFWMHMVQHEVMMLVAAPLVVLGRPLASMLWGLPRAWRPAVAGATVRSGLAGASRALSRPFAAWCLHAVALWAWHAPALFDAALASRWIHDLQHASFLVSALLFWWALFEGPGARPRYGIAVVYVFTTAVHTSVLGALLAFSGRPLYRSYVDSAPAYGFSAVEDQQLGGIIMWVPGGVVYLGIGLALFALWLRALDRRVEAST